MVINSDLKIYFHKIDEIRNGKPKKKVLDS